jgi:hypothetical protein
MKFLLSKIKPVKLSELITQAKRAANKPKKEEKMLSRKLVLVVLLGILGLVIGGCVMYAGGIFGGPAYAYDHPRYCYDCHRYPHWAAGVVSCTFYDFYFVGNGYYYRPIHRDHRVYVFRKYNYSRDEKFRDYYREHRVNDEDRVRIEKEYRGVNKGERQRFEQEYRERDKQVRSREEKEHKERSREERDQKGKR